MAKAKNISGIDCDTTAVEAIRLVLIARLAEMCSLRDRALKWDDPEGVHDMRVSSRRLRGALDDFSPYLRKRALSESLKEIKALADALGSVRDEDVAIIGLQKLSAGAPPEAAATLSEFTRAREATRKKARSELRSALGKTALKQTQDHFENELDRAIKKGSSKRKSKQIPTYVEVAKAIINQRLEELESLSDSFYHPLKVKPLHQMRIAAKHLRYALELFEECLGPAGSNFTKKVAGLQTSLGELHDADIWIEAFGDQLERARKDASNDHAAGSLWLLSHFVRLHSKHLRDALGRWQDWETSNLSEQLREYIKPADPKSMSPDPTPAPSLPSEPAQPSEPSEPSEPSQAVNEDLG